MCDVLVGEGTNVLPVEAEDGAGHVGTQTITILVGGTLTPPPTALAIRPATMTLMAGQTQGVRALDDRRRVAADAVWTVADALVAEVTTTDGRVTLRALAAGQTTVTATWLGLSAEGTVTLLAAGTTLPTGTTLWALAGTTPDHGYLLRAFPTDPASTPGEPAAYFFVEEGTAPAITAVTVDGQELWR